MIDAPNVNLIMCAVVEYMHLRAEVDDGADLATVWELSDHVGVRLHRHRGFGAIAFEINQVAVFVWSQIDGRGVQIDCRQIRIAKSSAGQ